MNLANLLHASARTFGDRPALSLGTRRCATYRELAARAGALADRLAREHGLRAGDRVAIASTNTPEFWEVMFGVWYAGLVAVPMNPKLHPKEFAYILESSGASVCFTCGKLAGDVAAVAGAVPGLREVIPTTDRRYAAMRDPSRGRRDPHPTAPSELAWLFYTSGTTGRPKGAMLTHRNLLVMVYSHLADVHEVGPEDAIVHAAPASHGSGMCGLAHFAKGAHSVVPETGGFEAGEIFELARFHGRMSLFAAPTMVTRMLAAREAATADFSRFKCIVYGGAPMYVSDLVRALDAFGPRLAQIYGQGEAPMTITALSREAHVAARRAGRLDVLGSAGTARTGVAVKVFDPGGAELPPGQVGEVVVRGDIVMAGYWNDAAATAAAIPDGWLRTGDLGQLDPEGHLTLCDRSKDMIISGGSNIYSREVEEVLLRDPAVLEVSVVGRPHPDWGEEVVAFVVPRAGGTVSREQLDRLCLENIGRFKRPREYRFLEALPKNNYGKVLKTELRGLLAAEARSAVA